MAAPHARKPSPKVEPPRRPENAAAIGDVVRHALQMMNACVSLGVVQLAETDDQRSDE